MTKDPSPKQTLAAKIALESAAAGKPKTREQTVLEAGYSVSMSRNPKVIFNSEGFKKALEELTKSLAIDKESRLLKLAKMFWDTSSAQDAAKLNVELAKMLGDYAPEQKEYKDLRTNRDSLIKPE